MSVRVLIVDDHVAVREGLRRSIEACGVCVIGEAGDGETAVRMASELVPEVVLMDVSLPGPDGIEATRRIASRDPQVRVVMLTMLHDMATRSAALAAGAAGYLTKDCTTAEIVALITSLGGPERTGSAPGSSRRASMALSPREREILQLVADGASTKIVARRLYISPKTAKNHLANIYHKLEVTDRTQAVMKGLRSGSIQMRV